MTMVNGQEKSKGNFEFLWESVESPIDPELEKKAIDAFSSVGFFDEYPELKNVVRDISPGKLGPCIFPFAKGKAMEYISIWLTSIFLYDDVLEIKGTGENEIEKVIQAFVGELKDIKNEPRAEIRLIAKAGEGVSHLHPESLEIFRESVRDYLESLKVESYHMNRLSDYGHPNIETYIKMRLPLSGTIMTVNMIDMEMSEILPKQWHKHNLVNEIKKISALLMAYQNDYFSTKKRDESKMNICFALEHDLYLDSDESKQLLLNIHNLTVCRLVKLCNQLEIQANNDQVVNTWIKLILNSVSGCAKWHELCNRY